MPRYFEASPTGPTESDKRTARIAAVKKLERSRRKPIVKKNLRAGDPKQRKPRKRRSAKVLAFRKAERQRKAETKAAEFARKYHSVERVEFVKSLPCFASGIRGDIENAHVCDPTNDKGLSRKASYLGIVPLSRECHRLLHRNPGRFTERFGEFDWNAAAAWTENEWQKFARGSSGAG